MLKLQAWLVGSRDQRLMAMAILASTDQSCVLPLLRRAMRDPDPVVMAAAAAAMERFRGRPLRSGDTSAGGVGPDAIDRRLGSQAGSATGLSVPRSVSRTR